MGPSGFWSWYLLSDWSKKGLVCQRLWVDGEDHGFKSKALSFMLTEKYICFSVLWWMYWMSCQRLIDSRLWECFCDFSAVYFSECGAESAKLGLVDFIYFLVCNNVETIEKNSLCVIWISHGLFSQWPWKGKNWPKKGPWSIGRTHFRTKIRLNMVHMGQVGTENPMGLSRFQSWYHRGPPYCPPFEAEPTVKKKE